MKSPFLDLSYLEEFWSNPVRCEYLAEGQLVAFFDLPVEAVPLPPKFPETAPTWYYPHQPQLLLLFVLLTPTKAVRAELGCPDEPGNRKTPALLVTCLASGRSLLLWLPDRESKSLPDRVEVQMGLTKAEADLVWPFIQHVAAYATDSVRK